MENRIIFLSLTVSRGRSNTIGNSKEEEEENKNLWESILTKVAQRDETSDSTLLILGDKGVGKKSLI